MPGESRIMRAVREGLNILTVDLKVDELEDATQWTKAVKTKLCEIGRNKFRCCVYARDVAENYKTGGEWLYDVTWLKYGNSGRHLINVPLVAECEWSTNKQEIENDFEKLLLAHSRVHLMIFEGASNRIPEPRSEEIVQLLARKVREFNGCCADGTWLLAAWERSDDEENGWRFRYFAIENGMPRELNRIL